MSDALCICYFKFIVDDPVTLSSTIFGFALSTAIIVAGVKVNHTFWKKLQKEKRETPNGRKGNVIEPVMSWFCILQSCFWPYQLLILWINTNEIISSDNLPPWLCHIQFSLLLNLVNLVNLVNPIDLVMNLIDLVNIVNLPQKSVFSTF